MPADAQALSFETLTKDSPAGISRGRANVTLVFAASVAEGISHLGSTTAPFQITALLERFHLMKSTAGLYSFFEIVVMALMMALSPVLLRGCSGRVQALAGAAITMTSHLLIFFGPASLGWIWALGAMAGIGYGLIFSACITAVARCENPDRIYSIVCGGGLAVTVVAVMVVPHAIHVFGTLGTFMGTSIIIAISAPALWGLGGHRPTPGATSAVRSALPSGTVPLLALWACYSIGSGMVWSFVDEIGLSIHVPQVVIVTLSSICIALGFLTNIIGAAIAGRVNRMIPLTAGIVGTALACLLTALSTTTVLYCAGVAIYWIFVMLAYAYLLAAAAVLDPSGRLGTWGGSCDRITFAIGGPLGGLVMDFSSAKVLGVVGCLIGLVMVPFCLPRLARILPNHARP